MRAHGAGQSDWVDPGQHGGEAPANHSPDLGAEGADDITLAAGAGRVADATKPEGGETTQDRHEVVAAPLAVFEGGIRSGDLLLRTAPGEGIRSAGVVISTEVESAANLAQRRVPVEYAGGGGYVEVDERSTGGIASTTVGRRLVDAWGRVPRGQMLVRPRGDAPATARDLAETALRFADAMRLAESRVATGPIIAAETIRYLSLEGGGGKGFAFLGALEALQMRGVLQYEEDFGLVPGNPVQSRRRPGPLLGIAGSSAGAITAMLLASGYPPARIESIMFQTDFKEFYDLPKPGDRPAPFRGVVSDGSLQRRLARLAIGASPAALLFRASMGTVALLTNPPFNRWLDRRYVLDYLACLRTDYGFHSGIVARTFFDTMISQALTRLNRRRRVFGHPTDFRNASFATHFALTGIKLIVTGANISTGKSEYFSVDTTPDFPVADAVRISMGIPIAFKPVFITDPVRQGVLRPGRGRLRAQDLRGLWVDGGTFNNQPIRAFRDVGHTLALRLDIEKPKEIDNLGKYLGAVVSGAVFSSEAHISRSWGTERRSIELETEGLGTLDFEPDRRVVAARRLDAKARVLSRVRPTSQVRSAAREEGPFLDMMGVTGPAEERAIESLPDLSDWRELISHRPTIATQRAVRSKVPGLPVWTGWPFQTIENKATGPINLDYYPVTVSRLPKILGREITPAQLLRVLRLNINRFIDTRFANFEPFDDDRARFRSDNPLGAIVHIDMRMGSALTNPDDGSVAVSLAESRRWMFSTIWTVSDAAHPVSGNREFGYSQGPGGSVVFYTRGADRTARLIDRAMSGTVFSQAHALWLSLQQGLAGFVRASGGAADIGTAVSARYDWDQVRPRYHKPTRRWLPILG